MAFGLLSGHSGMLAQALKAEQILFQAGETITISGGFDDGGFYPKPTPRTWIEEGRSGWLISMEAAYREWAENLEYVGHGACGRSYH